MNKSNTLLLYMVLFTLFITSCDEPKAENTKENEEASTEYTFAFAPKEEHRVARTANTYPYPVTETNPPDPAKRAITYTSSNDDIATVASTGTVTFVTAGTVTITATKAEVGEHEEIRDSYTLYITTKPADKAELVAEIKRAMQSHGDEVNLNYIDTSDITNMRNLFSDGSAGGTYKLEMFNGDISKWDVSAVTDMFGMFSGNAAFTQNLDAWEKTISPELIKVDFKIGFMFSNSGLKDSLPSWCEDNPICKQNSLSFS